MRSICLLAALALLLPTSPVRADDPSLEPVLQAGHIGAIVSVSISGDGRYVATGAHDHTAILWEAATGKVLRTFPGHRRIVTAVALSRDAKHLVTGSFDMSAALWDTISGKKLQTFREIAARGLGPPGFVDCVGVSADGKRVVTGATGENAYLWDAATGKKLRYFLGSTGGHAAVSADGNFVVTSYPGKATFAALCDAHTGRQLQMFRGHKNRIMSTALSDDGAILVTGSFDGTAMVWDTAGQKQLHVLQGHAKSVTSVAVSGDGKLVLGGSPDGTTLLWDTATGKVRQIIRGETFEPWNGPPNSSSVALSADGRFVVTGGRTRAMLWEASTGKLLRTFQGHNDIIQTLAVSEDAKHLVAGSWNRTASLWDAATGKMVRVFPHSSPVYGVAVGRDGKHFVTTEDKSAVLWDADGKRLQTSGDGKHVFAGGRRTNLWEAATGRTLQTIYRGTNPRLIVWSVALTADGKQLVTGSGDNGANLWDAESGKLLGTFQDDTDKKVKSLSLLPGGKALWTASQDGTTRLWDLATGKERCRIYTFDAGSDWLVLTPDGRYDGSPGAGRFLCYRSAGTLKLEDDEATRRRFHRPGLLAEAWRN